MDELNVEYMPRQKVWLWKWSLWLHPWWQCLACSWRCGSPIACLICSHLQCDALPTRVWNSKKLRKIRQITKGIMNSNDARKGKSRWGAPESGSSRVIEPWFFWFILLAFSMVIYVIHCVKCPCDWVYWLITSVSDSFLYSQSVERKRSIVFIH